MFYKLESALTNLQRSIDRLNAQVGKMSAAAQRTQRSINYTSPSGGAVAPSAGPARSPIIPFPIMERAWLKSKTYGDFNSKFQSAASSLSEEERKVLQYRLGIDLSSPAAAHALLNSGALGDAKQY